MNQLKVAITALPPLEVGGRRYLSYQAVTDTVAAFLFPDGDPASPHPAGGGDTAAYQRILETADRLCRELGYAEVVKLTPPAVPLTALGLYWAAGPANLAVEADELPLIHAGPSPAELLADGLLLDTHLSRLGLDEVSRQHFKIPVTASEGVIDLLHRAVASAWPNDYKGVWHDVMGMCIRGGQDVGANRRKFTVIVRGLRQQLYWSFMAEVRHDNSGAPYLHISLADEAERPEEGRFPLGQVVMTPGVAALGIDPTPYIARHAAGDWGELDSFDRRQNDIALKEGLRILSAYDVAAGDGETTRLWVITEADRSVTTALLPSEY